MLHKTSSYRYLLEATNSFKVLKGINKYRDIFQTDSTWSNFIFRRLDCDLARILLQKILDTSKTTPADYSFAATDRQVSIVREGR